MEALGRTGRGRSPGRRRRGKPAGAAAACASAESARGRVGDAAAAARTREILPRLEYARSLLGDICAGLSAELQDISRRNRRLAAAEAAPVGAGEPGGASPGRPGIMRAAAAHRSLSAALAGELAARTAALALLEAASWLERAGRSAPVTDEVPAAIAVLRRVSSALHAAYPARSAILCEASSVLGGVLADSAAVADARIDFGRSNADSSAALAQAKLTAESKLRRLYPDMRGARMLAVKRACC